ncbi:MAG: ATP-dependent sacrificial sulfur transferase LarE [Gemmatimonadales bacterium]
MSQIPVLESHLRSLGRTLLGYSGGVDSAVLAVAGRRALGRVDFQAVIGRSDSYPEVQYRQAREIAARFDIPLLEAVTGEMEDPRYLANPVNRCYFCKTELWTVLNRLAAARGFDAVIDGTNADDLGEHRPGLAAAAERGIRSPLAELGWSKAMVREAARQLGLPNAEAPAAPCLSSRVRYGVGITPERLRQVEEGEAFLRSLGLTGNLRVRHLGDRARIEADPGELARLEAVWPAVEERFLGLGFAGAELDRRGYRRGSMLTVLSPDAG